MSVLYNSFAVDEKYSALLEPALYANSVFADGVSCTSKYENGPAGGIYVHQITSNAAAVGTPGGDFTDEAIGGNLIPIIMNNNFQKSIKIYGVQAAACAADIAVGALDTAVGACGEGATISGLAALVDGGTAASATTAITAANVKAQVLALRKQVADGKGKADTLICSTAVYAAILEAAGAQYVPTLNDDMNRTGNVGQWLGFTVIEASALANASAKYYDKDGTAQTIDLTKVDMICYNHEAFSMISNFDVARIIDSESFAGSKAQVELNVGFAVTSAQVAVKKHA